MFVHALNWIGPDFLDWRKLCPLYFYYCGIIVIITKSMWDTNWVSHVSDSNHRVSSIIKTQILFWASVYVFQWQIKIETYRQRHSANSAVWYEMQQVILFSPLMIFAPGLWTIKKKKFSNKRLVRCAYKMANVYTIWVWRELGKSSLQFFFIRYFFHFLAAHAAISPPRSKSSDNLAELSRSTPRSWQYCNFLRFNSSKFSSVPSVQRLIMKSLTLKPFIFQTLQVISQEL